MAGNPWEWRLPLVVASNLEQVEEVGTASVDLDGVLFWRRLWLGDF